MTKSYFEFKLTLPTAFDEAGICMLDSIREIFDVLGIRFESIQLHFDEYTEFKELVAALQAKKCPVLNVHTSYWNPESEHGSHAMVATGLKNEGGAQFIQMKNSHADNPNEPGKFQIRLWSISLENILSLLET